MGLGYRTDIDICRFKAGIVRGPQKRKREEEAPGAERSGDEDDESKIDGGSGTTQRTKKKRTYGPKGPNPLAVRKTKKQPTIESGPGKTSRTAAGEASSEPKPRKRRKKGGAATEGTGDEAETTGV